MADSSDKHSRTEAPSKHKLKKSREQGQVARSQDLSAVLALIAGMIMFCVYARKLCIDLNFMFRKIFFDFNFDYVAPHGINQIMAYLFMSFVSMVFPIIVVIWLVSLVVTTFQVGIHFSVKPLEPSFSKINPVEGFKRLFSTRGLVNTILALMKMTVIFLVAGSVLWNEQNSVSFLMMNNLDLILTKSGSMVREIAFKSAITLLIMAVIDYAYQRWQYFEDQRMTKHELKEEYKEHEGNPTIKSKLRSLQKSAAKKRGLKETVKEADVVITNPFHIAVAVKYDRDSMKAPVVVAKGARLLAERIKEFAKESKIDIVENVPLARALYKEVNVGFEISPTLYVAVAEVLAIIFKKRKQASRN
jgi:flagellar biosynthesis protein FlhB